jgi:hypothetical protein
MGIDLTKDGDTSPTNAPETSGASEPQPRKLDPRYEPVVNLLNESAAVAGEGRFPEALEKLGAAEAALGKLPAALQHGPAGFALRAATREGRGQMAMRQGDMQAAFAQLSEAELLRQCEIALGGRPAPLPRAVSNLNLASASQRIGRIAEGLVANARCLELLSTVPVDANNAVFGAAGLEARATMLAQLGQVAGALEAFEAARSRAALLLENGHPQARSLLAEILVNASRLQFQEKQVDAAMAMATEAADLAFAALEASQFKDSQAANLYVAAEMNQVAYGEAAGAFSRAEDALFRVVKLIGPNPQVVERGVAFYSRLLTLSDEVLEAGGLPREECVESLARLRAMVPAGQQTGAPVS